MRVAQNNSLGLQARNSGTQCIRIHALGCLALAGIAFQPVFSSQPVFPEVYQSQRSPLNAKHCAPDPQTDHFFFSGVFHGFRKLNHQQKLFIMQKGPLLGCLSVPQILSKYTVQSGPL